MSTRFQHEPAALPAGPAAPARGYALRSELVRLSLPAEQQDANRLLAWANSICLLFLLVGMFGSLRLPVTTRALRSVEPPVPVVFTAPEEAPPPAPAEPEVVPRPEETEPVEAPPVVTAAAVVAAVANPLSVEFPVPVQAAVAVAIPALAAPPPPVPAASPAPSRPAPSGPPAPVSFNPAAADVGTYPKPTYPRAALRARSQGTVTLGILVDALGNVTSVQVAATSGDALLDDAALQVVRNRWRFPPGPPRNLIWDCTFRLE